MDKSKVFKDISNQLKPLINEGFDILEVNINEEVVYFLAENFAPPVGGTIQALPYLSFKGVCIDDFLKNSVFNESNINGYVQLFVSKGYDKQMINYQISENHQWRFYSK